MIWIVQYMMNHNRFPMALSYSHYSDAKKKFDEIEKMDTLKWSSIFCTPKDGRCRIGVIS